MTQITRILLRRLGKAIRQNIFMAIFIPCVAALAVLFMWGGILVIRVNTNPASAPIVFRSITDVHDNLCPGETLTYHLGFEVQRPTVLHFTRSVWNVSLDRNEISDSNPTEVNYPDEVSVSRPAGYPVPPLPPGKYEYILGASEAGSRPVFLRIPFIVGACS